MFKNLKLAFALNLFLSYSGDMIMASFFPREASSRNISEFWIGLILSFYAISASFGSPLVEKLPKYDRRYIVVFGLWLQAIAILAFYCNYFITNNGAYIAYSCLARLFAGLGCALSCTAGFGHVTAVYPDDLEDAIGKAEAAFGFSIAIFPMIGGVGYTYGGYFMPFFTLTLFIVVMSGVVFVVSPVDNRGREKVGQLEEDSEDGDGLLSLSSETRSETSLESDNGRTKKLRIKDLVTSRSINMLCLNALLSDSSVTFLAPIFTLYMMEQFHFSASQASTMVAINAFAYIFFSLLTARVCKLFSTRVTSLVGMLLCVVALMMVIPSALFHVPQDVIVVITAFVIGGAGQAFALIPILPAVITTASEQYPDATMKSIRDVCPGYYNFYVNTSSALGPLAGGLFASLFGFRDAATYFGLILLSYCTLFAVSEGKNIIKGFREKQKEAKDEKNKSDPVKEKLLEDCYLK
mmetsp:Transcript_24234/g.27467  ORF Transcript_24234/g.27467 Transcript_24234/m.27467 type:complete len:466 (-) Transcript_24234:1802-3199(-)